MWDMNNLSCWVSLCSTQTTQLRRLKNYAWIRTNYMKQILIFGKNSEQLYTNYEQMLGHDVSASQQPPSPETSTMTKVFQDNGWKVFWTCIEFILSDIQFFSPATNRTTTIKATELDSHFNAIVFRVIGSVDDKIEKVVTAINILEENFSGYIVNHPKTMKYAIRKDYILELQKSGFPVIATTYFENSVSFSDITTRLSKSDFQNYLIKPVTGELSKSVAIIMDNQYISHEETSQTRSIRVKRTGEEYLRYKQNKVGGWLLQPIVPEIWDGEYQVVYFGSALSHGFYKSYIKTDDDMLMPSNKHRNWELNEPSKLVTDTAIAIRNYFQDKLSYPIHQFRMDYIKVSETKIQILEYEMFNPGVLMLDPKQPKVDYKIASTFEKEISKHIIS